MQENDAGGSSSVAIGFNAGASSQGNNSVAVEINADAIIRDDNLLQQSVKENVL